MKWSISLVVLTLMMAMPVPSHAGPYAPAAGQPGSTAVHMDDPDFIGWATGYTDAVYGTDVQEGWKTPEKALGQAVGDSYDIVCLGRGGRITMTFGQPIRNRAGWDFAVFENAFNDTFLELGYVEVSSDGVNFIRFPNRSLTAAPVPAFGAVDPTNLFGLAGKYRQGYGTPFDLNDLKGNQEVISGGVELNAILYVRIMDIIGDGSYLDSAGQPIYDPYPTVLSAGFDLDAIGVKYQGYYVNSVPTPPVPLSPENGAINVDLTPELRTGPFDDSDVNGDDGDFHGRTRWLVSTEPDFETLAADHLSRSDLTSWIIPAGFLTGGQTYYWKAKHGDFAYQASSDTDYTWSEVFVFSTSDPADSDGNGIPDLLELTDRSVDLDGNGVPDADQTAMDGNFKALNSATGEGPLAIKAEAGVTVDTLSSRDPDLVSDLDLENSGLEGFYGGIISFRLTVPVPGAEATVTVYLSGPVPEGYRYYKYLLDQGWRELENAVFGPERRSVQLTLRDGATGDADGLVNGIIVDPGGLAIRRDDPGGSGVEPPTIFPPGASGVVPPAEGEVGFGGGGGCFIDSLK